MNKYAEWVTLTQQFLHDIQTQIIQADQRQDQAQRLERIQMAFIRAHDFAKRKHQNWCIALQKIMYHFLDLAFETNKQFSIKQVFKSYRSLTQTQNSQSLKAVLEYYRDKKLEMILEEITEKDMDMIINMPDIENDEASTEIIFSSFKPEEKEIRVNIKNKLKIVWEGYKNIVEIVKVSQKLQNVYLSTLSKAFQFLDRFNRKYQLQKFCQTLRQGLQTAMNKRDKTEQLKGIYIDVEKADVNTKNIEIRMEQFKITMKLGLWRQSFQILQDIYNLMRVRRGVPHSSVRCQYYENLALLFKQSNYWHYHAYALYCHYQVYMTKSKLEKKQKQQLADNLLLSMMCIPPVTLQSRQSKQSQQKICSMLISSTKIPSKQELYDTMVSKGIAQNSSNTVRELWNFMLLEFDLSSLSKGLELLNNLSEQKKQFKTLLEQILIYKQLISIAEVYSRIKIDSLLNLIPLSKQKILSILLASHHQQIIDFSLDESQGIITFEQKKQQATPNDKFLDVFLDTTLISQKHANLDEKHILKQAQEFMVDADNYFWNIRQYKINQFKKKLKKPIEQLRMQQQKKEKAQREQKQMEQNIKKVREQEAIKEAEQKRKKLGHKKIIIDEIISIKQNRTIRIDGKKIEQITDQQLEIIDEEILKAYLEQTKKKLASNKQTRINKIFTKIQYIQRERRVEIKHQLQKEAEQAKLNVEKQKQAIKHRARRDFQEKNQVKAVIAKVADDLKQVISKQKAQMYKKYQLDMENYKNNLANKYKEMIISKAKQQKAALEKQKNELEQRRKTEQNDSSQIGGMWTFRDNKPKADVPGLDKRVNRPTGGDIVIGANRQKPQTTNPYEQMAIMESKNQQDNWFKGKEKKQQPKIEQKKETGDNWIKGKVKKEQGPKIQLTKGTKPAEQKKQTFKAATFQPAPTQEKKQTKKMGKFF